MKFSIKIKLKQRYSNAILKFKATELVGFYKLLKHYYYNIFAYIWLKPWLKKTKGLFANDEYEPSNEIMFENMNAVTSHVD